MLWTIDLPQAAGRYSIKAIVLLSEALAALPDGPVFIAGDTNRQTFTGIAAMPRRDALMMMGDNMKQALLGQ